MMIDRERLAQLDAAHRIEMAQIQERSACVLARCRCAREGFTVCSVDGRPLEPKVKGADECPCGRLPTFRARDNAPICRWMGLRWYGLPAPLRWLYNLRRRIIAELAAVKEEPTADEEALPALAVKSCGCIVILKDAWVWIKRRLPFRGVGAQTNEENSTEKGG